MELILITKLAIGIVLACLFCTPFLFTISEFDSMDICKSQFCHKNMLVGFYGYNDVSMSYAISFNEGIA